MINFIQIRRSKILVRLLFPQFVKINLQRYNIKSASSLEMIKYIINLALSTCMENNIPVDIQFLIQYLSKGGKIRFDQSKNSSHSKKKKMIENSKKISRRCYGEQKRPESNLDFCIIHRVERVPFVRLKSPPLPHFSSSGVERKNVKLGQ